MTEWTNSSDLETLQPHWENKQGFRCHVAVFREDEGDFSAIVLNLPGVGSRGDSADEAWANIREAIAVAIEAYREAEMEIPWTDAQADDIFVGSECKWIIVHA